MSDRKVATLALVGRGEWGQNYIKTINGMNACQLPLEFIKTRDYPNLFDQDGIDGVIIATPTNTHFSVASDLLEHSFTRLLVEKPIVQTRQQAQKLQAKARKLEALIMAGHIQLYDPTYQVLKANLNKIGKIKKITYHGLQSPTRENATVLEDWGPHPVYLFLDLVGRDPKKVSAQQIGDDNIHFELDLGNGIAGRAEIGWTAPERKRQLIVEGAKGSLTLDYSTEPKRLFLTYKDGKKTNLDFPSKPSPLEAQITEFLDCIRTGREPKSPLDQGVKTVKIIELVNQSLTNN